MTWCNSYSNESKYNITVTPSVTERIWNTIQFLIFISILCFIFAHYYTASYVAVFLILITCFAYYLITPIKSKCSFSIELSGVFQHKIGQTWLISKRSKLGYWGCYLYIEKIDPLTNQVQLPKTSKLQFYFKDGFSPQDYARVSRVILKRQKIEVKEC